MSLPVFYLDESVFHYELDMGNVFNWAHCWDDVAVGANVNLVLHTGTIATRDKHFAMKISAVGVCKVQFFESVRGHTGGTAVPGISLNRVTQVSPFPTTTVRSDMTIAGSKGTLLDCQVLPGASLLGLGGVVLETPVWHLLNNESYLLEVHNMSAATSDISMTIQRIVETEHTHAGD